MRGQMPPFDGKLSGDAVQDGNQVLSTDASGLATVTFPQAFKNPPIVLADGGNDEDVYVIPNPTTTGFVAQFRSKIYPNALITSSAVRIYWAAFPPSPTLIAGGGSVPGPPGSQGFQGSTGAQGVQGAAGSPGSQGSQGSQGSTGIQGFQGATGAQGITGSQGTQGNTGTQGATGSQGSAGTQGSTGTQGTTGTQGSQGAQGSQGLRGFQGFQGANGAQGAQGTQGDKGVTPGLRYTYIGNVADTGYPAAGQIAQSDDNFGFYLNSVDLDGNDWTDFFTANSSANGQLVDTSSHRALAYGAGFAAVLSDIWLLPSVATTDTTSFTIGQPAYLEVSTGGPQGSQGAQGATGGGGGGGGSQGAQGAQGATGAQGAQGFQGATGAQGSVGTQGATGAQGAAGTNGAQGTAGTNGTNGSQGAQGFQGAAGAQGSQGFQGVTGTGSQGVQGAQGAQGGGGTVKTLPYFKGTNASGTSIAQLANVGFSTVVADTASAWNATTKVFTVPTGAGGTYRIMEHSDVNPGVARYALLYKNGTAYIAQSTRTPATIGVSTTWTHDVVLAAGDTIALRYSAAIVIDTPTQTGAENNYFVIQLLPMTYV